MQNNKLTKKQLIGFYIGFALFLLILGVAGCSDKEAGLPPQEAKKTTSEILRDCKTHIVSARDFDPEICQGITEDDKRLEYAYAAANLSDPVLNLCLELYSLNELDYTLDGKLSALIAANGGNIDDLSKHFEADQPCEI